MRLYHNTMSLNVYRNYSKSLSNQSNVIGKLSSGYKVNSAGEDPNALAKSELLRIQIRGLQMAQRNVQDGISMLQAVDSSLENIGTSLNRIRELTVQAGGLVNPEDKKTAQNEINVMLSHINTVAKTTEFNGVKLIGNDRIIDNTKPEYLSTVSGANTGEKIEIPTYNLIPENIADKNGNKLSGINVTTEDGVTEALGVLDATIDMVVSIRSKYGAIQNRMDSTYLIANENSDMLEKAESSLRDADIAEEMMYFARNNILIEAGNAMIAQTNRMPQDILGVLQRLK